MKPFRHLRLGAGLALALNISPARAVVGGYATFAGAEIVCGLKAFDDGAVPLKMASAVLIAPNVVATARHLLSSGTVRLQLRCGGVEMELDVRDQIANLGRAPDLVLITLPDPIPVVTAVHVPRTEAQWTRARAEAVEVYAAGYGGQYYLDGSTVEAILRKHVPDRLDPRLAARDAAKIAALMAHEGAPPRDAYLSSLMTPEVQKALRTALDEVRPTAWPLRPRVRLSRFRLPKSALFGYETPPGASAYVGDSGGAIFARDAAGEFHLLGVISRGGLRVAALPRHLVRARHLRPHLRWFRRRGLRANFPATPSVFGTRLLREHRAGYLAPGYCAGVLTAE